MAIQQFPSYLYGTTQIPQLPLSPEMLNLLGAALLPSGENESKDWPCGVAGDLADDYLELWYGFLGCTLA